MKYIILIALPLFLVACGDTISQSASGSGTNVVAGASSSSSGSTTPAEPSDPTPIQTVVGDLPICDGTSQTAKIQGRCVEAR